jgi:predicted RNA-binding Zn ribbon-like protein
MTDPTTLLIADFAAALANTAPWIWRDGADHLPDTETLRGLLIDHGLDPTGLAASDIARAHELRERLRAPFEAASDTACAAAINDLLAELQPVRTLVKTKATWAVQLRCPSGRAVDNAAAAAADALAQLLATDGRDRLHHCAADHCHGVFVDTTRNRSRRFCMPELCGNRTNVAAHRTRNRTA